MKTKVVGILFLLACFLFVTVSCNGLGSMPEPTVCTLVYRNTTDHALNIGIYQYTGETMREHQTLNKTVSLDIPAHSSSYKDVEAAPPPVGQVPKYYEIQSCTITFDDGKVLTVEKGVDDDKISRDMNPIILGSYKPTLYLEGISVYNFSITDYHYSLAE